MQLYKKSNYKEKILIIVVCLIYVFIIYKTNIGCIWKKFFNIICPGCGYTRALISVIKLDFKKAFYYHPLFWTFPILIYCFISNEDKKKNILLTIIIILFVIVWIYRVYNKIEI